MRSGWVVPVVLWGAVGCGGLAERNHERRDHEPSFTAEDWPAEEEEDPYGPTGVPFMPAAPPPAVSGPQRSAAGACGADGVVRDSIRVSDQNELDQLQGCERIAGDFTLRAFAGMDATPLSSLRRVEGGLSVYGASEVTGALDGFRSLEEVGRLLLYGIQQLDLEPLGRLRNIGDLSPSDYFEISDEQAQRGLEISNCSGVSSLRGLSALEHIEQRIQLSANPQLVSVAGLDNLRGVDELFVAACPLLDLQGLEQLSVQSLLLQSTALTSLDGLGQASRLLRLILADNAALASLDGGVLPPRMEAIEIHGSEALPNLRGLEEVRELDSLNLSSASRQPSQLVSLRGLERLEHVGYFVLAGLTSLSDLSGLDSLRQVGQLQVSASALRDLSGLLSLQNIDQLSLYEAPELTGLHGLGSASIGWLSLFDVTLTSLAGLEQISLGNLDITLAPALVSLDGLPPLTTLDYLAISQSPALEDVQALTGLSVLGTLILQDTGLTNLDALGNLRQLTSVIVNDNAALVQMDGLGAVAGLGDVGVSNNDALLRLPDFQGSGAGTGPSEPFFAQANFVEVSDNLVLTTLTGLGALRSVFSLSIQDNPGLVSLDLSGLESAGIVLIRGNTSLDDEPLAPLELIPSATIKIVSNRSGPARLSPCPWRNDGVCDEEQADCAAGSDVADCSSL